MNTTLLLIFMLQSGGNSLSVEVVEFNNQPACEAAMAQIDLLRQRLDRRYTPTAFCVRK